MLAWLSVWVEVQSCIWLSWCHCHLLPLAPVNPDWYQLTRVFPDKIQRGCNLELVAHLISTRPEIITPPSPSVIYILILTVKKTLSDINKIKLWPLNHQSWLTSFYHVAPWLVVVLNKPCVAQQYTQPCHQFLLTVNTDIDSSMMQPSTTTLRITSKINK